MFCVCKFSNINCHDMIKRLQLQLVYNCYCVCNSSSGDFQGLSVFVLNWSQRWVFVSVLMILLNQRLWSFVPKPFSRMWWVMSNCHNGWKYENNTQADKYLNFPPKDGVQSEEMEKKNRYIFPHRLHVLNYSDWKKRYNVTAILKLWHFFP